MLPKSIRWRLPLSYAGIALLATIALGAVLVVTLRGYYALRERDNLLNNAQLISDIITRTSAQAGADAGSQEKVDPQINLLSFISQSRIRLFDANHNLLIDSGDPAGKQMTSVMIDGAPPGTNMLFFATRDGQTPPPVPHVTRILPVGPNANSENIIAFPKQTFGFSVAGSPYGIRLRRDSGAVSWSSESVSAQIFDAQGQPAGTVEVSNGPAYGTEIIAGVVSALVGAGAAAVLLAAAAGWFMSRTMTAPLLLLTDATTQMAKGHLSTRVGLNRTDEFGALAHTFDDMAIRIEMTVVTLRRFAADAAHQIHTPLTAVHADLELAASEPNAQQQQMFIERALGQLKRLETLTNDLLDLSRLEAHAIEDQRKRVDVSALVRELSETFASRAEQAGIAFNVDTLEEPTLVSINETQFRHAICNLLDNAIKFTQESGTITVGVCRDGDQVALWVSDTGIGISAEDLPDIFNRFHRARNAAAYPGSGLGLAIIKAIVEQHHGQVSVQSEAGSGTRFTLRIPAGTS